MAKKNVILKKPAKTTILKQKSEEVGTNVFCILSLIFGLAFFIPFAPILAIVFGFVGLSQIRQSKESGKGLAITGIILGFIWLFILLLIVIFIIGLLAAVISSAATANITTLP